MNVVSWIIRASEGYTLSAPILEKITHTLFIDDLKGYAKSNPKLKQILNLVQGCMNDAGMGWNSKKCKFGALKKSIMCLKTSFLTMGVSSSVYRKTKITNLWACHRE